MAEIGIRRYGSEAETHAHSHRQLVLPLAGRLEMEVAGRSGAVAGRRGAVIPCGVVHSFLGGAGGAFLVVDLPADGLASGSAPVWAAARSRPFVEFGDAIDGHLAFLASAACAAPLTGLRAAVAGEMLADALARDAGLAEQALPRPVAAAIRLIEACAAAPITVADIARAAGVSASRLHALFLGATGVTPIRYLAAERIRRAGFLLETSRMPIAQIVHSVGYSDQSAFTRAFRRETGLSPGEWRARNHSREFLHKEP